VIDRQVSLAPQLNLKASRELSLLPRQLVPSHLNLLVGLMPASGGRRVNILSQVTNIVN